MTGAFVHFDQKLDRIIHAQGEHGERLASVETTIGGMRDELQAVKTAQATCPGRLAEMRRQARRDGIVVAAKILAWTVGLCTTAAGVVEAMARVFSGGK